MVAALPSLPPPSCRRRVVTWRSTRGLGADFGDPDACSGTFRGGRGLGDTRRYRWQQPSRNAYRWQSLRLEGQCVGQRVSAKGKLEEYGGTWSAGTVQNDPVFAVGAHDVALVFTWWPRSLCSLSCSRRSRVWWCRWDLLLRHVWPRPDPRVWSFPVFQQPALLRQTSWPK